MNSLLIFGIWITAAPLTAAGETHNTKPPGADAARLAGVSGENAATVEPELRRYEFVERHMGVPFRIALYAPDEAAANAAARAAYRRVKHLNSLLSDYEPDSELMRLCRTSGPGRPVAVSPELHFVLSRAVALSRQTEGAFDVTVGPLVQLWRQARRNRALPDSDQLAAARRLVGYRQMRVARKDRTVELLQTGMRLDLGGIAKGYAADEALAVLKSEGITRALVDAGGDMVLGDPPPGAQGWRIGVASLTQPDESPDRVLLLKNAAVATSGDAYQFIEIAGRRYSHLIDPRTGVGLTTSSSVTVVAADGLTADSLASAVSVLGPQRGLKLIESVENASALVVVIEDGEPAVYELARFADAEIRD
jgi:FAD:protein FMN transferase